MIIIITATIAPGKDVGQLTIRDENERLNQYIQALEKTIKFKPNAKIVFCDNSGYDTNAFDNVRKLAEENDVRLEIMSFKGDSKKVAERGKGYGEGEIVKYVLENSHLAVGEDYMIKITGRLVVDNISIIVNEAKKNRIYFNVPNLHRKDILDTRLYAMPKDIFDQYFSNGYKNVNDKVGYYLEKVYKDIVLENNLRTRNFPKYPRIVGKSGTGGIDYEYSEWKSVIKDYLSIFNIYGKMQR